MSKTKTVKVGRIAFREEGDLWVAYHTGLDTMEGATVLGSIRMTLVLGRPVRKAQFMELMKDSFADITEDAAGVRPTYPDAPTCAPEHERSKS